MALDKGQQSSVRKLGDISTNSKSQVVREWKPISNNRQFTHIFTALAECVITFAASSIVETKISDTVPRATFYVKQMFQPTLKAL